MKPPIPASLAETLSPEWLSAALSTRYAGLRIDEVTPGEVVSRMSTNARFEIASSSGLPAGLPSTLCVKGYFEEYDQGPLAVGFNEAMFYRDLERTTGVRTLRPQYADGDLETKASVLITNDLVAEGGEFLDPLSPYSVDDTAATLEQLARLHATTWTAPMCATAAWLDPWFELLSAVRGIAEIRFNFDGDIGAGVPEAVRSPERLYDGLLAVAKLATEADPWCVVHGDPHAANLIRTADGLPGFVDWQIVQRGPWYLDVGYHLGCALDVEARRANERDLLRHSLDHLAAAGVAVPTEAEAWALVRLGLVHGFYMWGITLVVEPAITRVMLERLGNAVDDHGAFDAVGL